MGDDRAAPWSQNKIFTLILRITCAKATRQEQLSRDNGCYGNDPDHCADGLAHHGGVHAAQFGTNPSYGPGWDNKPMGRSLSQWVTRESFAIEVILFKDQRLFQKGINRQNTHFFLPCLLTLKCSWPQDANACRQFFGGLWKSPYCEKLLWVDVPLFAILRRLREPVLKTSILQQSCPAFAENVIYNGTFSAGS